MRSRLILIMQAFPSMTPAQVWDLPYVEWLIVALGAQRWAEEQREKRG